MYRIGRKQKRAILTEDGHEVVVFAKGQEELAEKVCSLLNAEVVVKTIPSNPAPFQPCEHCNTIKMCRKERGCFINYKAKHFVDKS